MWPTKSLSAMVKIVCSSGEKILQPQKFEVVFA
jgi:hypothetical protein